jgi:hypothetical protein
MLRCSRIGLARCGQRWAGPPPQRNRLFHQYRHDSSVYVRCKMPECRMQKYDPVGFFSLFLLDAKIIGLTPVPTAQFIRG